MSADAFVLITIKTLVSNERRFLSFICFGEFAPCDPTGCNNHRPLETARHHDAHVPQVNRNPHPFMSSKLLSPIGFLQ